MSDAATPTLDSADIDELDRSRAGVRVLIITGLGLNCEVETAEAFRLVGATPESVHLLDLLDQRVRCAVLDADLRRDARAGPYR